MAILLTYLFICYTFESIYHFFYPIPGLLDAVEEVDEEENKAEDSSNEESNQDEPKPEEDNKNE